MCRAALALILIIVGAPAGAAVHPLMLEAVSTGSIIVVLLRILIIAAGLVIAGSPALSVTARCIVGASGGRAMMPLT